VTVTLAAESEVTLAKPDFVELTTPEADGIAAAGLALSETATDTEIARLINPDLIGSAILLVFIVAPTSENPLYDGLNDSLSRTLPHAKFSQFVPLAARIPRFVSHCPSFSHHHRPA
jgi:hypothetical protein